MVPNAIEGKPLFEALFGLGILAFAWLVARSIEALLVPWVLRVTSRTSTILDDLLVAALKGPLKWFLVAQGGFVGLTAVSYLDRWQAWINKAWVTVILAIVFVGLQRAAGALLTWYGREVAARTSGNWDNQALPIIRRMVNFIILAVGSLMVLDRAGVSISPLLAGLGIGGLAVALALQPTLSNFVSGTYVLSDGSITPGDFIEVRDGPMGNVVDVGWRITKILTPANNVVTIPNAKLADSVVTNYSQPQPTLTLSVTCGVSYESNLARVEQVALEVMDRLRERSPHADKSFQPSLLFREFGDSNITFLLVMRAIDRSTSYLLQHELIKEVHERFKREGIEMSYPVRKLVFPADGAALRRAMAAQGARGPTDATG